jgi:hypothetical protein
MSGFVSPWLADALYAGVSLMWFVPDRRFQQAGNSIAGGPQPSSSGRQKDALREN